MSAEAELIGVNNEPQEEAAGEDDEQVYKTIPDFAYKMARAESSIRKLIALGIIHVEHDGRTVRIHWETGKKEYDDYMKLRTTQYHASRQKPKPEQPEEKKSYGQRIADEVWDDDKFLMNDLKPQNDPERSSEAGV